MRKLLLLLLILSQIAFANKVKVTIIERITQFIQWPYLETPFRIGVYNDESMAQLMKRSYENKKIHKFPIKIYNIKDENDPNIDKLNLIYFTKESDNKVSTILKILETKPTMIITDHPDDVYHGMHLGFFYQKKKIKFLINKTALESAQLKASYKLLRLAKIVEGIN